MTAPDQSGPDEVDGAALAVAAQAADDFMALFRRTFLDERSDIVSTDTLRQAQPAALQALATVALPAQCADVDSVTTRTLDEYDQRVSSNRPGDSLVSARYSARGYGTLQVRAAFDRALATFPGRDTLPAAEAAVSETAAQYQAALTDLEAAVNAADLGRVGELRGAVEIALPAQLHDARSRLLELRIAQATAEAAALRVREQEMVTAIEQAREQAISAAKHLQRMNAELNAAQTVSAMARDAAAAASRRIITLREEHQQMLADYEQDRQRRVRQLAGLPASGWGA